MITHDELELPTPSTGDWDFSESEPRCKGCGEPETGEFGWFDGADDRTVCQRCGSDPYTGNDLPDDDRALLLEIAAYDAEVS